MPRPSPAIIFSLKSDTPEKEAMPRQVASLVERVLEDRGAHLQVEAIAGGALLFLQSRGDLDHVIQLLEAVRASLPGPLAGTGRATRWALRLLKPALAGEALPILQACRDAILLLFGPPSAPALALAGVTFLAPGGVKFLQVLWDYYLAGGGRPGIDSSLPKRL